MKPATTRESVYHAGERFVQEQAGAIKPATAGLGAIHATIPEAAFDFLRERAFIVIAATSADGDVWASQLGWEPGFMRVVDDRTLDIDAFPSPDDPVAPILQTSCKVGTVAIDFATHRRMRLNGTSHPSKTGIQITTDQVYANCPKYIAARSIESRAAGLPHRMVLQSARLGEAARALVASADTFFIASAFGGDADASHRGGPPGFVEVVDGRTLRWPDYYGNSMFMTLGNIAESPAAGLLFSEWSTGTTLQLTGRAHTNWDPAAAQRFAGAKRVVEFAIDRSVLTEHASPLRWTAASPSRFYPRAPDAA